MGVPEFISAARTLQAAEEAAVAPPAAADPANPQQGGPTTTTATTSGPTKSQGKAASTAAPSVSAGAAAAKARRSKRVLKGRAELSLLTTQASGLEAGELVGEGAQWEDVDPVQHPPNVQAWLQLCAAAKHAAKHAQQQQQQPAQQWHAQQQQQASGEKLQGERLPQLTRRLAGMLTTSLAVDPTCASSLPHTPPMLAEQDALSLQQQQQQQQGGDVVSTAPGQEAYTTAPIPGAVAVDELAATAAAMSVELRGDTEKGCRLRKRKALADFLGELAGLGLSKRQADVPPGVHVKEMLFACFGRGGVPCTQVRCVYVRRIRLCFKFVS